jgi:predicted DNA-binding transcriptional regulator AlpA
MTAQERLAVMPAWPALMNAETGALYLGLSEAGFRALVRREQIRPVDMGMRLVRWRRGDLDALVTALPAYGLNQREGGAAADDFDAALERSARRGANARWLLKPMDR